MFGRYPYARHPRHTKPFQLSVPIAVCFLVALFGCAMEGPDALGTQVQELQFVPPSDTGPMEPLTGDFDGDGKGDKALWSQGTNTLYMRCSAGGVKKTFPMGVAYMLVVGDTDGNGQNNDIAFWNISSGSWFVTTFTGCAPNGGYSFTGFGVTGDVPMLGDTDGDGADEPIIYRPSNGYFYIRYSASNIVWAQPMAPVAGDQPLLGDMDGDGKDDVVIFRAGVSHVFTQAGNTWTEQLGTTTDILLLGDVNGDGILDYATRRPSDQSWHIFLRVSHGPMLPNPPTVLQFGQQQDLPLLTKFQGTYPLGKTLYRPSTHTWHTQY